MTALTVATIDADGWCAQARRYASPNCDSRPPGAAVELLVIHNISLPAGRFGGPHIADLFTNRIDVTAHASFAALRALAVSAHFLVRRDGAVLQFVSCAQRAWHAGVSRFGERTHCNDFSVGIEMEGTDDVVFTPAQYAALAALTVALAARYPLAAVQGHEHIAPGRKSDPGPCFDWRRLGVALAAAARRLAPGSAGLVTAYRLVGALDALQDVNPLQQKK